MIFERNIRGKKVKIKLKINEISGLVIALIIVSIVLSTTTDSFLTFTNIINLLRQISLSSILAIGLSMTIITGGIDISGGNVAALTGIAVAWMISYKHLNLWLAIVLTLLIGSIIGLINGFNVAYLGIPPFMATIAMMFIIQGITFQLTDGYPIYKGLTEQFLFIGKGYIWKIPTPVIITAFIFILAYFFLNYLRTGQYFYAIGGNEDAVMVSGVNVKKVKMVAYLISGLCAALTGIMMTARLGSAQPAAAGMDFFLTALTAVVIGGVALTGGKGSVVGILVGILFLAVINNGLTLLRVSAYMQWIIIGFLLILAIIWHSFQDKLTRGEVG